MSAPGDVVARARRADVSFVAAAVAYYLLGSIVPVVVLGFVILQTAFGSLLAAWLVAALGPALSPRGETLLARALVDPSGSVVLTVVGVVGLLWGWSRLYRSLEGAFERVYETAKDDSLPARALAGCVVVPAISIGMALAAAGAFTNLHGVAWEVLQLLGVALALFPVFVTLPPKRPGLRAAFVGASSTALAWGGLRLAFDVSATYLSYSVAYGLLGGIVLVVSSLYLATLALLLSVSLTATLDAAR